MPDLLGNQQDHADRQQDNGRKTMVMLFIAMPEGIHPDGKGQEDHEIFESDIFDNIDPKNG